MSTATSTEPRRPDRPAATPRTTVVLLVLGLAVALMVGAPPGAGARPATGPAAAAVALPDPGAAEAEFVARINQLRTSRGLAPLSVDAELTSQARQWAATMSSQGRIFHAGDLSAGISANWQKLGENVGRGGTIFQVHGAYLASAGHRRNILDPSFNQVGAGAVWGTCNGYRTVFTVQVFMRG